MTIGIIISSIVNGGAQRVAITLARWLNAHENKAALIVLSNTNGNKYSVDDIPTAFLEDLYPGKTMTQRIRCFDADNDVDIYLTMGVPMCIYVIPALNRTKAKIVVSERSDPRHAHIKLPVKVLSRLLMKKADGFVFQTADAEQFFKHLKGEKAVIPNPVADVPFVEKRLSNSGRKKEIVTAGRLVEEKNHRMLINAFYKIHPAFPEYKLIIYGEGRMRSALQALCRESGIEESVELPGSVNDLHERILNSELFVLTSDFEGMPNSLLEAMAMGLTCISTDCPCGGARDIIDHGKNGLLIQTGNTEECANAMADLLRNKETADGLGESALKTRVTFGRESICQRWLDFLNRVQKQ